MVQRLNTAG